MGRLSGPIAARRVAFALLVLSVSGCGSPPLPPAPAAVSGTASPTRPPAIHNAILLREQLGLRADEPYVAALDADPAAHTRASAFGLEFPVTAAEAVELTSVQEALEIVERAIVRYGPSVRDQWGGVWFDGPRRTYVAQFTGDLERNRAALLERTYPEAPLEVRHVRWTLDELDARRDAVSNEREWFESIGAHLSGIGVDPAGNSVLVDVESGDPGVDIEVIGHFDGGEWMRVRVSPVPWRGGYGSLQVEVSLPDGSPATDVWCRTSSRTPAVPPQETPLIDEEQGSCALQLEATTHLLQLVRGAGTGEVILRKEPVSIQPGEEARLRFTVPAP